jgi:tRNA(Ile)-lysidine synthase
VKDERRKAKDSQLYGDLCSTVSRLLELGNLQQRIYVGYSGGIDSHVLLHCCASIIQLKDWLTAVYVHHGLQAEADFWADHCEKTANDLGVKFIALTVHAQSAPGESPEEAARNARYAAFKSLINVDDALLLAQHREDQLETVLLQLFRGSGLRGLSGMPERIAFGTGVMLRPLLNTPKQTILAYATAHQLCWIEDPSNQSNDYDRNFLRNAVVPLLKQRWQSVDKTVARSARHCADAQVLVDEVADELFSGVFNPDDNTLGISRLKEHLSHPQQLVIRHWFQFMGLKMPAQALVERILTEIVAADEQRDPAISGKGYSIRRYRNKLYCLTHQTEIDQQLPEGQDIIWPCGQNSIKVSPDQILCVVPASKGILRELWLTATIKVRLRRGGEKICLPGRTGHHTLKKLFQEAGIPPWKRDAMPLIYLNDALAAVGDRWISAAFYSEKPQDCISLLLQSCE